MKTTNNFLGDWIYNASQKLAPIADSPRLEAQILAEKVLNQTRAWLLSHPDYCLDPIASEQLETLLNRRLQNFPLPYIIGEWEFYGLRFWVTEDVLIPRPETEILVDQALTWCRTNPSCKKIIDVGTGTGCIAVSLASNLPEKQMIASDISPAALSIATRNIAKHQLSHRVLPVLSDLLVSVSGSFDLICANLPYIPQETLKELPVAKYEPRLALEGGSDGLVLISRLLQQASTRVSRDALLLLEIEAGQGESALKIAKNLFPSAKCSIISDYANLARILRIEVSHA